MLEAALLVQQSRGVHYALLGVVSSCLENISFPDMTSISRQPQVFSRQMPKM